MAEPFSLVFHCIPRQPRHSERSEESHHCALCIMNCALFLHTTYKTDRLPVVAVEAVVRAHVVAAEVQIVRAEVAVSRTRPIVAVGTNAAHVRTVTVARSRKKHRTVRFHLAPVGSGICVLRPTAFSIRKCNSCWQCPVVG